jgi:tetratricopeptide (TPR) repeat protein
VIVDLIRATGFYIIDHYPLVRFINAPIATMPKQSRLDTTAYIVLSLVLFLAPIFFIPSFSVPFTIGKSGLLLYGTALAFVLWMVARLKDGVFEAPKNWFYASSGLVAVTYLVSALVSGNREFSLSGQAFELGTASFIIGSLVFFALIPLLAKSKEKIAYGYYALLGSFLITGLFHALRFVVGPEFLSFGFFTSPSANLIGKWNDLSIFFGLISLSSLLALELGTISKKVKILSYIAFFGSLALLVIANFQSVWIVLALFSLVFFVYQLSFKKAVAPSERKLPAYTLLALILSVFFVFAGNSLGELASNALGISQIEVRPSWGATTEITVSSLSSDPVFGVGPNRFSTQWLLAKPEGINNTLFWNVDFNYGIGFVPSMLVTTGVVGALAIVIFLALYLMTLAKSLMSQGTSPISRYLVLSTLFGSLYLWIFSVIYVPSQALWILTLGMTGLFVASLREDGAIKSASVSIATRPTWSFVSVLLTILALIGTLSFAYHLSTKILANVYFQRGVSALQSTGALDQGEADITRAISLSESPLYYRVLSELYLARLNELFVDKKISQIEAQSKFQALLATAIQSAQRAVALDGTDYQNHLALGRVFEAVVPLNISGAYDNAKTTYGEGLARNPQSPEIELILARLEITNKDNDEARVHIDKALAEKADYADAIFLLSQIDIAEGNISKAIESVRSVATLSPNDAGVFFQLGLLYYNQKDYVNAIGALERAVVLSPEYANAKYFLGLSYYQVDNTAERAINEFKDLATTNPDNAEIKAILDNLEAGKPPFTNQPDSKPERRSTLPVKDSVSQDQ